MSSYVDHLKCELNKAGNQINLFLLDYFIHVLYIPRSLLMSTYSAGNKIERIATDMSTKTNNIYDYTSFFNIAI